jgi:protease I
MAQKKIIILMESDFYEPEIAYYQHRFAEEGIEIHFMTRLWGQKQLTFTGHENRFNTFQVERSFEDVSEAELSTYSALIVPSGMVADRLRYTEDLNKIPPATAFLKMAFENKSLVKGMICHSLWLAAPIRDVLKGRKLTCHNNLYHDALAYGADFQDADSYVDDDLITARTGGHCHLLAKHITNKLNQKQSA